MNLSGLFKPLNQPSPYPNSLWSAQHERYNEWVSYYTGDVLDDLVDSRSVKETKKFPLRINLVKQVVMTNSYAVLGEWNDTVFNWRSITGKANASDLDFLKQVGQRSLLNSSYIRQVNTFGVLGGMVWGIQTSATGLRWTAIPPEYFFPVYSTLDDDLLECIISMQITGKEAMYRWGVNTEKDYVQYQEHWDKMEKVVTVDEQIVERRPVIDGIIPYVYIPRMGMTGDRFGESIVEDIRGLQDEVNMRMADIGDAVVKETHKPIMLSGLANGLKGIKREGNLMDLGMGLGNTKPEVHDYSVAAVPANTTEFVGNLIQFARNSGNTPPVAYGEDEGSQRSGMTLVVRMWPLLKAAQSSRAFIADGMTLLATKTLRLGRRGGWVDGRATQARIYAPDFPVMLPKDREQIVNEVVQLRGVDLISDERALELLDVPEDRREEELGRLRKLAEEARNQELEMTRSKQSDSKVDGSKESGSETVR